MVSRIEWWLPKPLLWIAAFFVVLVPGFALAWFMVKFNLPFFHAGDKGAVAVLGGLWWLAAVVLLFGWRGKR